ncbi:MAG TPA: molecular chaperone HtpG [Bacteroidales bacterium]|nr:molecular chaperone HtpG [Bacteroidales bacterium]HPB58258.1 molecular chaperone HtpG [Bacteroidales bacterium]HPZ04051.1 molecular chaperone HtpG [Bacteroidales bacterium]HQB75734.1 molecular chaperone HtpG [Bacteroidales bacterium]
MQKGKINVKTENIFPIIKKFLYSDHDIFLRELVSNAVDATQKLKTLVNLGSAQTELGDLTIQVVVNKEDKTIRVIDRGIGMTKEEVVKYITEIAFSSAEEFLDKYKGVDSATIIGHFGLGFYSSFMVAKDVEILTKSYLPDAKAVRWTCDGSPEYTLEEIEKEERGTEIILHIAEDSEEFLDENRIVELLHKYARFLPIPIQCGMEKDWTKEEGKEEPVEIEKPRIINNTDPIWKKSPNSLTQEDYSNFYRELYPMSFEEPLFQIHLNVDYPFNLEGVLYFPKVRDQFEIQKNKVQLYSNQVFITDQLEGVIPEFMMLLHGVIDSPDIPLNVSRSYLQSDQQVKKISGHITKKVADKLEEMFKENREDFEKKWDDIKVFIEYGAISDEKFFERVKTFFLLKNVEGKYFTFDEYREKIEVLQKDKNENVVHIYSSDLDTQHVFIQNAKERSYDVLLMDGFLDTHFINMLEQKLEKVRFIRVDANVVDKLIEKEQESISKLSEEESEKLKGLFTDKVEKTKFNVLIENLSEEEFPVMITRNEFMRRFQDMEKLSGQKSFYSQFDQYNLIVNGNHEIVNKILAETDAEKQSKLVEQMIDLALLSQNLLTGEKLSSFLKRSISLIE